MTSELHAIVPPRRTPRWLARRVLYKLYELTHPNEPWLAQGAVQYLDRVLKPSMVGLEWGSGRSTTWFAERLKQLLSIEYDPSWYAKVQERLDRRVKNAELLHVPLDHARELKTYRDYDPLPRYVAIATERFAPGALDLVVVDGHYRLACVKAALPLLRPGGMLLVDNTDRMPLSEWGVPAEWPMLHQSGNVMTQTTIWRKP